MKIDDNAKAATPVQLFFIVQALDNEGPDVFCRWDGRILTDEVGGTVYVYVSEISRNGKTIQDTSPSKSDSLGAIRICTYQDPKTGEWKFVLTIPTNDRDVAGRVATILCAGPIDGTEIGDILRGFEAVTQRENRNLKDINSRIEQTWQRASKKKQFR